MSLSIFRGVVYKRASAEALKLARQKKCKTAIYSASDELICVDGKTYRAASYRRFQGRKGLLFDHYSDIFLLSSVLFEKNAGQATTITRKLCLHGRTQRRQTSLYLRLPSASRKNAHSSFHFWLLLIGHAPVSAPCGAWAYPHAARTSQP